jgi:hypothetical protein
VRGLCTVCHIGWHTEKGLAIQFVERYDNRKSLIEYEKLHSNSEIWNTSENGMNAEEDDSGIWVQPSLAPDYRGMILQW